VVGFPHCTPRDPRGLRYQVSSQLHSVFVGKVGFSVGGPSLRQLPFRAIGSIYPDFSSGFTPKIKINLNLKIGCIYSVYLGNMESNMSVYVLTNFKFVGIFNVM